MQPIRLEKPRIEKSIEEIRGSRLVLGVGLYDYVGPGTFFLWFFYLHFSIPRKFGGSRDFTRFIEQQTIYIGTEMSETIYNIGCISLIEGDNRVTIAIQIKQLVKIRNFN